MIFLLPLKRVLLGACCAMAAFHSQVQAQAQMPQAPEIAARAYLLLDVTANQILAEKDIDSPVEPASLTKLMTAYLVFDALHQKKLSLTQRLRVPERAWKAEGSRMFIEPGAPVPAEDLLRGLIVQSGNDAAVALAIAVAGNEGEFIARMNREAKRLGMNDTQFLNPTGLSQQGHYSTAHDLAVLSLALLRDFPQYARFYAEKSFTHGRITQENRNRLLFLDPTVDGLKTGHTEAAGYCLIATAKRGDADKARRLISVVLGTNSDVARMQESQKLLNYGYQFFDAQRLYKRNDPVATLEIFKGAQNNVKLGFERDMWLTLPKDKFANLKATLSTQQPMMAPLLKGQKAGVMKLTQNDKLIAELPVVALEDVPLAGVLGRGWDAIRLLFK